MAYEWQGVTQNTANVSGINAMSKIEIVPTEQITINPAYQSRAAGTDDGHIRSLVNGIQEDSDLLSRFPLKVAEIGGKLILLDGHHRRSAAIELKLKTVPVLIAATNHADALIVAASSNEHAGSPLKRTNADRRRAVEMLLSNAEIKAKVDTAIAQMAGVSPTYVANIRKTNPAYQSVIRVASDGSTIDAAATGSGKAKAPVKRLTPTETPPGATTSDAKPEVKRLTTTETSFVELQKAYETLKERDAIRNEEANSREDRIRLLRAELDKSDKKIKGLEKEREELIKERDSLANDYAGLRFEANTWKKRYMQKTGVTLPGEALAESATPEAPAVAAAPKAKAKRDRKPRSNV